jgi:serine protease AprX
MSQLNERGANSERNSALWGTGGRGGDRSSVLWGKGGRGMVVATMVVALAAPLAATASKAKKPSVPARPTSAQLAAAKMAKLAPTKQATKAKHAPAKSSKPSKKANKVTPAKKTPKAKVTPAKAKPTSAPATPTVATTPVAAPLAPAVPAGGNANSSDGNTYVAPVLLTKAENSPEVRTQVIISSSGGTDAAKEAVKWLTKLAAQSHQTSDLQNISLQDLDLIGGITVSIPARWLDDLTKVPGLIVTPDAMVKLSGDSNAGGSTNAGGFTSTAGATRAGGVAALKSSQLWPYESGNASLWLGDLALYSDSTPAIAIVDSGVEQRSDFGTRVIASVNLSTIEGNTSLEDERGHGTFVAGIAAGAAPDLTGAAPTAPIVSVKVMDKNGRAKTSDVIRACQWILDNKEKYNIRVANFSLHSSYGTNFYRDPLDMAVEKLWFSNVVVVAASGNYGIATGPSGVRFSPGNDPFVITVGALDLGGSAKINDDSIAPWSAYGYTYDGFYKPEIAAPGRYMVGPVPAGSTIAATKVQNMVGLDRVQLSGTSFAAPVVAGTVAQMLARHPNWTPDQVKGALMQTARRVPVNPKAAGVGEVTVTRAVTARATPNPNKGLNRFLISGTNGLSVFDAMSWADAAKSGGKSWNSMSWADQSWSDMSWADQSWTSMSWADQSWSDMSWSDMSWADMSWADSSQEDGVEGDATSGEDGYALSPDDLAALANDSGLSVPVDPSLPVALLPTAEQVAVPDKPAVADAPAPAVDQAPADQSGPADDPIVPAPASLVP